MDHHSKVKQHFIAQILLPVKQGASGNISHVFTGTTSDLHMRSWPKLSSEYLRSVCKVFMHIIDGCPHLSSSISGLEYINMKLPKLTALHLNGMGNTLCWYKGLLHQHNVRAFQIEIFWSKKENKSPKTNKQKALVLNWNRDNRKKLSDLSD